MSSRVLLLVLLLFSIAHTPFSKVEESFTSHALFDLLFNLQLYHLPCIATANVSNPPPPAHPITPFSPYLSTKSLLTTIAPSSSQCHLAFSTFDHQHHPGPVPRSFIPALLIATPVAALRSVTTTVYHALGTTGQRLGHAMEGALLCLARKGASFRETRLTWYMVGRCVVAVASWCSLSPVARLVGAASDDASLGQSRFYLLFLTQFAYFFYASRLLPHVLALAATTAIAPTILAWSEQRDGPLPLARAAAAFGVVAAIVRAEVAVFGAALGIAALVTTRRTSAASLAVAAGGAVVGAVAGLSFGATVSVLVDSRLWGYPVWPEAASIMFNAVDGNSAAWGTHPPYHYLLVSLPKMCMAALPLSLLGAVRSPLARRALLAALLHVAAYSLLPHKEDRFVSYVLPLVNAAAALGFPALARPGRRLLWLAAGGALAASALLSMHAQLVAYYNYPGAEGLAIAYSFEGHDSFARMSANWTRTLSVYQDNLSVQTGATHWTEKTNGHFTYADQPLDFEYLYYTYDVMLSEEFIDLPPHIRAQFYVLGTSWSFSRRYLGFDDMSSAPGLLQQPTLTVTLRSPRFRAPRAMPPKAAAAAPRPIPRRVP
uniref:Mannosyltransferase n=1 Tax=Sexangularia sp. CB-2014 TaxID=1486929 RepID=A0A7S1VHU1_9EUKA